MNKYVKAFKESCRKLEEITVYGSKGQRGISKPGWGYRYIPYTKEINIYKDGKIVATIDDTEDPQAWIEQHKGSDEKLKEETTKNTGLSYITFWHDDDIDTIGTVFFDNDDAFHKFYDYLISLKYDIIDNGDINNIIHDANTEIERWQENYFD